MESPQSEQPVPDTGGQLPPKPTNETDVPLIQRVPGKVPSARPAWLTFLTVSIIPKIVVVILLLAAAAYGGWRVGYKEGSDDAMTPAQHYCAGKFSCNVLDKPVIYLYPQATETVNVQVHYAPGFTKTIPAYDPGFGWQVTAQPDGRLINNADGKTYPYLFWEGRNVTLHYGMKQGFSVKGSQTEAFLHDKLRAIGLSPHESQDFIDYWLPIMSKNPYNLVHFDTTQYTKLARLKVNPAPDATLRVLMVFQASDTSVRMQPQSFGGFQRHGFTVVEWGGTEQLGLSSMVR